MGTTWDEYRIWLLAQRPAGATPCCPATSATDCVRFETEAARAEVSLWEVEGADVCELSIERKDTDERLFYLHFVLDDLGRARELFYEMAEVLATDAKRCVRQVLLTCTAGMTTTLFAHRMNEVARALGLAYEFSALPLTDAAAARTDDYAAILIAPQASGSRGELSRLHPTIPVFEIPARVFGSYDAATAVRLVLHALFEDLPLAPTGRALRDVRGLHRTLVVTLFWTRTGSRLGYRLFERGAAVLEGLVRKARIELADVDDLFETMGARSVDLSSLDAVGLAVPGVTHDGIVHLPEHLGPHDFDLAGHLAERFGLTAYVDNNCNAAAVGCYVTQDEYESVSFFRQELGHPAGGLGTVIAGTLLTGHMGLAGEPKHFEGRFVYPGGYDEARWSPEGMGRIACDVALACIATIAPDALYLAVDTLDDTEPLRRALAAEVGEDYVPALHVVDDYVERVYLGEMALLEQRLRLMPRGGERGLA